MDSLVIDEKMSPAVQSNQAISMDVVMSNNCRKEDEGSFASESSIPCAPSDANTYVSPCTPHRHNFNGEAAASSPDKSRVCSSSAMMGTCCEMTPIARNTSEVFLSSRNQKHGLLPLVVSPEEDPTAAAATANPAGPPREISLSFHSLDETALLRGDYAQVESDFSISFRSLDEATGGGAAMFHGDDRPSYHQGVRHGSFVSHFRDSFTMEPYPSNFNNEDDDSSLSMIYQAYHQASRNGSLTEFGLRESQADAIFKDDDASSLYRPIPLKKGNSTGTHFSIPSIRRGAPVLGDDNSSIRSWNESTIDGMSDLGSLRGSFDEADGVVSAQPSTSGLSAERKSSVFDWLEDVRNNPQAVEEAASSKFLRAETNPAPTVRRASTRFTPIALTGRPPRRTLFPPNVSWTAGGNDRNTTLVLQENENLHT